MANEKPDDLANLIDAAAKTATRASVPRVPMKAESASPRFRQLFAAALVVAALWVGYEALAMLGGPRESRVQHDLEDVVDMAQRAIEEERKRTGQLPAAVPNAALAAVVQYEHDRNDYMLITTVMGVRVTLQRDGRKVTEKVGR